MAHCLGVLCKIITNDSMKMVIERLLPLLGDIECTASRLGATECLHRTFIYDFKYPHPIFINVDGVCV